MRRFVLFPAFGLTLLVCGCVSDPDISLAHGSGDAGRDVESDSGSDVSAHPQGIVPDATPDAQPTITTLPYDGGAVEWDGWAGDFFQQYCVTCHNPKAYCTECHSPGDPRTPDYTKKAPVLAHETVIRCGIAVSQYPSWRCGATKAKQFPKLGQPPTNPFPSDDDRNRIVEWFDAGCP